MRRLGLPPAVGEGAPELGSDAGTDLPVLVQATLVLMVLAEGCSRPILGIVIGHRGEGRPLGTPDPDCLGQNQCLELCLKVPGPGADSGARQSRVPGYPNRQKACCHVCTVCSSRTVVESSSTRSTLRSSEGCTEEGGEVNK